MSIFTKLPQPSLRGHIQSHNQLLCEHVTKGLIWPIQRARFHTPLGWILPTPNLNVQVNARVSSAFAREVDGLDFNLDPANLPRTWPGQVRCLSFLRDNMKNKFLKSRTSCHLSNSIIHMCPWCLIKAKSMKKENQNYVHIRQRETRPPKKT